jgi:hypothetical protein
MDVRPRRQHTARSVYATMRWAYPLTFVAMAVEGAILDRPIGTAAMRAR